MPYSNDVYIKAKERISERRSNAQRIAQMKREQFYAQHPRLAEIDRELGELGAATAISVLRSGDAAGQLSNLAQRSLALQEEYDNILESAGLSHDALEPAYVCRHCNDTGFVERDNMTVMCECFKKLMSDISCESLNEASPLALCTFDSFSLDYYSEKPDANGSVPRVRMGKILDYCRRYAEEFTPCSKGLLMRGATGLGKTHLSLSIANEVIRKGYSVIYVTAPDILNRLEREHFNYKYDSEQDVFNSLIKCDLLIIDDLGTEFMSQFSIAAVYNIFNSRILSGKPIILNTNLTMTELLNAYSQRFISRVMGACDRLDFIGEDIRLKL